MRDLALWMVAAEKPDGDEINRQCAQRGADPERRIKIVDNSYDRQQRPGGERSDRDAAKMGHANWMDDVKRHECQRRERNDRDCSGPRAWFEDEKIERGDIPKRREAAKIIVGRLHQ